MGGVNGKCSYYADPLYAKGLQHTNVCSPGKDMAMGSLWITIGTILAAFKIERTINEKGELVDPLVTHSSGLIR